MAAHEEITTEELRLAELEALDEGRIVAQQNLEEYHLLMSNAFNNDRDFDLFNKVIWS